VTTPSGQYLDEAADFIGAQDIEIGDAPIDMKSSMEQLAHLGDALGAMSQEEKLNAILGLRKPANRAEYRQAGRTNKNRPVLLADVVDWQSGDAKGTTTEGMKPSVRAPKRKSAGRLR
jgi:hypothetical protein